MKSRLSITLVDNSAGLPLEVLFERALRALALDGKAEPTARPWLAKIALRAVCEAILRENYAPFPLDVEISCRLRSSNVTALAPKTYLLPGGGIDLVGE